METEGIQIGPVHADPRGKFTHGGEHREHIFTIYTPGVSAHVIRRASKAEAEQARGEAVHLLAGAEKEAKPKIRPRRKAA